MFTPLPQITIPARIKENKEGGEVLCFNIHLGPVTLVCIANIPAEDQESAPVYVKFKMNIEERDVRDRKGRDKDDDRRAA